MAIFLSLLKVDKLFSFLSWELVCQLPILTVHPKINHVLFHIHHTYSVATLLSTLFSSLVSSSSRKTWIDIDMCRNASFMRMCVFHDCFLKCMSSRLLHAFLCNSLLCNIRSNRGTDLP